MSTSPSALKQSINELSVEEEQEAIGLLRRHGINADVSSLRFAASEENVPTDEARTAALLSRSARFRGGTESASPKSPFAQRRADTPVTPFAGSPLRRAVNQVHYEREEPDVPYVAIAIGVLAAVGVVWYMWPQAEAPVKASTSEAAKQAKVALKPRRVTVQQ